MSDNTSSNFQSKKEKAEIKTINTVMTSSKASAPNKASIDIFYDNRKSLFDICGNIINKESYPFINILSTYLVDIVESIDSEIKQSTRNSMVNWREKKNPKLLSKFINSDDNINIINRSMNKITSANYLTIVKEITDTLMQDNFRKLPDYSKFLFDTVIKKCLNDESFAKDYMQFLVSFDGVIGKNIKDSINQFITELFLLLEKNKNLKDFTYFSYVKDVTNFLNIGVIFSNIYLINVDKKISTNVFNIIPNELYKKFMICLNNINNFLEWIPSDMDELNSRIYLIFGIIETMEKKLIDMLSDNDKNLLNDILTMIYNVNNIPNKIKFKVLDIQDMIKTLEKANKALLKQYLQDQQIEKPIIKHSVEKKYDPEPIVNKIIDIVDDIPKPAAVKPIFKGINYSSLKLVQLKSNSTPEVVAKAEQTIVVAKPVEVIVKPVEVLVKPVEVVASNEEVNVQQTKNYERKWRNRGNRDRHQDRQQDRQQDNRQDNRDRQHDHRQDRQQDNRQDNRDRQHDHRQDRQQDNRQDNRERHHDRQHDTKNGFRNKPRNDNLQKDSNINYNKNHSFPVIEKEDSDGFIKIERKPRNYSGSVTNTLANANTNTGSSNGSNVYKANKSISVKN